MSDPFIGEIKAVGFDFAPRGWAKCEGQLIAVSDNTALFSLLGTRYGGDGRTTFGLPDLRGRNAVGQGRGPGLTTRIMGQQAGREINIMSTGQLPTHTHEATFTPGGAENSTVTVKCNSGNGNTADPTGKYWAKGSQGPNVIKSYSDTTDAEMAADAVTVDGGGGEGTVTVEDAGGSQAVDNMPPWICVNYIIALDGLFPSRS